MSTFKFLLFFTLSSALLLAQLTNNTVTATASQSTSAAPDEAVISITVQSGAGATFDQIVNALSGVGVTAANLSNVFGQGKLLWNFQLTVPLAQLETTTATLTSLEKSISQNRSGLSLSFNVSGTQFSGQASNNCNYAALFAQARTQAQQIAVAAGLAPGSITALSGATGTCSLTTTFATATFSQPEPNTITVSASLTNAAGNDQGVITLTVLSPATSDLSDITNALTGNGITGATLSGLYTSTNYLQNGTTQTQLDWSLTITVPLSKLTATLAQIASASEAIAKQNSGLTLNVSNASTSASQSQQAAACSQSTLINSAQALAQQIATAAGVSVGPVLNVSQGGSTGIVTSVISGVYPGFISSGLTVPCALTVQYQLLL